MTSAAPTPIPVRSARERLRPIARSIFGLLAGYCAILLVWFAAYLPLLFMAARSFDEQGNPRGGWGVWALVVITALASFLGGAIGTRLARRGPLVHAGLLAAMEGATLLSWVRDFGAQAPPWFGPLLIGGSIGAIMAAGAVSRASVQSTREIHSPTT